MDRLLRRWPPLTDRQIAQFTTLWQSGMLMAGIVATMAADTRPGEAARGDTALTNLRKSLGLPERRRMVYGASNKPWSQHQIDIADAGIAAGLSDFEISVQLQRDLQPGEEIRSAAAVGHRRRTAATEAKLLPGQKIKPAVTWVDRPMGELPDQDLVDQLFAGQHFQDDPRARRREQRFRVAAPAGFGGGASSMQTCVEACF